MFYNKIRLKVKKKLQLNL